MRRGIPKSHVAIMQDHDSLGAVLPQAGMTKCSPACVFYTWCGNFENLELCKGFKLIENGQNTTRIMRTLSEIDKLYVENSIRDLPIFKPENQEVIVRDVLRILEPSSGRNTNEESTSRLGFRGMLDAVSKGTDTPSPPKPITCGFGRGFAGMLDEISRDRTFSEPVVRSFGTNKEVHHHPQYGVVAMAESAFGETHAITRKPVRRGFGDGVLGMLDQLSRGSETPIVTRKSRGMPFTFRGVLDHLNRKQEEENENAKAVIRSCGFKGMLEDAFGHENPINTSKPILRGLQHKIFTILNAK